MFSIGKLRIAVIWLLTLSILVVASNPLTYADASRFSLFPPFEAKIQSQSSYGNEWNTLAANPERTSWVNEQLPSLEGYQVEWYRPIEAYIPQNIQIITAYDSLYISTARGLYVLYASDPDGSGPLQAGDERWRFDTELPLGNSPTVVDGVVYVGGFDRKLHALNALTGEHLWAFDGAEEGYSANPLVVNGQVLVGNRDGRFYAIGAHGTVQQGRLLWAFKAGGPITLSAAYKDGVVYFASDDNYAYALSAGTGQLVWKSDKLPGDGFHSYWPVVYEDKVIFSGSPGYRHNMDPGTGSMRDTQAVCPGGCPYDSFDRLQKDSLFFDKLTDSPVGPVVPDNEPWAAGKTVIDGSRISEYLENNPNADAHLHKPWRRVFIVLNRGDGREFTYDSDGDGYSEYAPIAWWGTRSGNAYPPVIGPDGIPYQNNVYSASSGTWSIPQGLVMGWKIGTSYLSLVGAQGAVDEPQALSVGGGTLYRSICCDRVGSWVNLANPRSEGMLWGYNLSSLAPGYDEMWWGIDPEGLPRLVGNYGTKNGVYHNHGVQNPLVPYHGRLFIHRSNAIIAFGPGPSQGKRPLLKVQAVSDSVDVPAVEELKSRLEGEMEKILSAGNLRPGYYNAGQVSPLQLKNYFDNPGDTLYTLTVAYPHLSPSLQQRVKDYLRIEFQTYFDPSMYARRGWAEGSAREAMPIPPEVQASMANGNKSTWVGHGWSWNYPQNNFYAMWKYAELFGDDAAYINHVYALAKSALQVPVPTTDDYFSQWPWELNGYIAGYIGFLNLQQLAGMTSADADLKTQVEGELARLIDLRANSFSKDTYWVDPSNPERPAEGGDYHNRAYNISRNFIMLTPELGAQMRQRILPKVQEAVQEYNWVAPYWFVSRYDAVVDEGVMQNLYDYNAVFQARAYILREPYQELVKYLDVPAFERGDLLYINNLVTAIEAATASQQEAKVWLPFVSR